MDFGDPKLVIWLVFNAVLPLSSIALIVFGAWINGKPKTIFSVIRDGQVCFYCVAVLGTTLHDFMRSNYVNNEKIYSPLVVCFLLLGMIFSTFIYGIAVNDKNDDPVCEFRIGLTSIFLSISTLVPVVVIRQYYSLF